MRTHQVPQPSPDRMVPVPGHPLVVGVVHGQSELVPLTAAAWAAALGNVPLVFGFVDEGRVVDVEYPDGSVRHSDLNPDQADDSWLEREREIRDWLTRTLSGHTGPWVFHYLAGRPDRALTHLARAVDASAIVVGARNPTSADRVREFLAEPVGLAVSRHQHRPVIVVPVSVVDWKSTLPW